MREEILKWLKRAEEDLNVAKYNHEGKKFYAAAFFCHQTIEKALKALYIEKKNEIVKTHDLILLAKRLNAPNEIIEYCSKINPAYLDTRYPDIPSSYSYTESKDIINSTEEVLIWIKNSLKKN